MILHHSALSSPGRNHLAVGGRFRKGGYTCQGCGSPCRNGVLTSGILPREVCVGGAGRSTKDPEHNPDRIPHLRSGNSVRSRIWGICIGILLAGLLVSLAMAAPSLVVSPSSGKAGTTVTVTGSSFDLYAVEFPQASVYFRGVVVASNIWFSGNGFSTSFQVPVGTPPGTYTVQAIGPRDSAATTFTVVTQPDAGFSMDPTSGMGRAPLTVYFTDTSTGTPASWRWNFGDGSVSPLQNPVHTYPGAGTYTVTLTVTNAAGSSSESRTITVYTPTLVVSPSSGKTGTTVTVTGNSFCLYGIEQGTAALSFDGISPSVNVPMTRNKNLGSFTTTFSVPAGTAPGSYAIRASGPVDSVMTTFSVINTAPHAVIDAKPLSGMTPLTVHFSGTRSSDDDGSVSSYRWDFGDDTSATGDTADHTFTRSGEYRVTLTVTDNEKQKGTSHVTITAENAPPVADARASPTSGSDPLTVTFDGSHSYDSDGSIVAYRWDFGDGTWENTAQATHEYRNLDSYTAVLKVTDDKGASATGKVAITVGNEPPVAQLSVTPKKGPKPLSVTLDGSRSHDPDDTDLTFAWDFGDGESGSGREIMHTYGKDGIYQITLIVSDPDGASDREEATVNVEPPFPWDILILVIAIAGGGLAALRYKWPSTKTAPPEPIPQDCHFPEPEVHVETASGVEYAKALDRNVDDLPDISVDIRSGIWKEENKG